MQPGRLKYHLRPLEHLWANYRDNRIATACAKNHSFFRIVWLTGHLDHFRCLRFMFVRRRCGYHCKFGILPT